MRRNTRRRAALNADAPSLIDLPEMLTRHLIKILTPDSKLALRGTCKRFQEECDSASGLTLRLCTRTPTIHSIHSMGMLTRVSLLDTAAANRSAISIGCQSPAQWQQITNALPQLQLAQLNSSQATLVELLLLAAPQLSRVELTVSSATPTVVKQLAKLPQLSTLHIALEHPAWMKACTALGQMTQLQSLVVVGKPLQEAARHGDGSVSCQFWEDCITPLTQLTKLDVNLWLKAVPGTASVHYSSLQRLRQLSVPYCSGKVSTGATAATLQQLGRHCSGLTSLTIGVHEFNWDVSALAMLTQLRELDLHNPFLKEVWGLQPFTGSHLAPLAAATNLTSLTISTLRLPLMSDVMQAAGQPAAAAATAVALAHGSAAAAAAALAAAGGAAFADMLNAIALGAVAGAMRSHYAPGSAAAVAAVELQEVAAAAIEAVARRLPGCMGARSAAAAPAQREAAAAAAVVNSSRHSLLVGFEDDIDLPARQMQHTCHSEATARKVVQAIAAHIDGILSNRPSQAAADMQPNEAAPHDSFAVNSAWQAAFALAAAVAPAAAAAAAADLVQPNWLPGLAQQQQPHPAAAGDQQQHVGGNPLAVVAQHLPVVELAGPAMGLVAVPVVPPPPPPPPVAPAAADALAAAAAPVAGAPVAIPAAAAAAAGTFMGLGPGIHQLLQERGPAKIAGTAASAAASVAAALLPQLPLLTSLKRLTVGTTHGRFLSGVSVAAMAPNLTVFEDLSEISKMPPYAADVLGGLSQLQLLTVNVDTLQLHASAAGALTALSCSSSSSSSGTRRSSNTDASEKQQQQQQHTGHCTEADSRMSPAEQQQQQQQALPVQQSSMLPVDSQAGLPLPRLPLEQATQLLNPAAWRGLDQLRCLRLLMLGHVPTDAGLPQGGRVLPRIAGITRLELCSAFGGRAEYAMTYTIAEDPLLWQEQVGVEELRIDGGVLLGGFFVDAAIAALLKQRLTKLRKLEVARCPDLELSHLEDAVKRQLAPHIVVKRDCAGVNEAGIVALNERLGKKHGVLIELVGVEPGEYDDKSFTYAVDA